MDAKSLINPLQRAELSLKQEQAPDEKPIPVWQLEQELSPAEIRRRKELIAESYRRLYAVMVTKPYPWIYDVRVKHWLPKEMGRQGFAEPEARQPIATDWMPIDTDSSGAAIELQVRNYYWEDDDNAAQISDYNRRPPHFAFWLRLHDATSETASEAVEVFDFPGNDVRMKGVSLRPDSPHWEKVDQLLTDLESIMGLAPQPATSQA